MFKLVNLTNDTQDKKFQKCGLNSVLKLQPKQKLFWNLQSKRFKIGGVQDWIFTIVTFFFNFFTYCLRKIQFCIWFFFTFLYTHYMKLYGMLVSEQFLFWLYLQNWAGAAFRIFFLFIFIYLCLFIYLFLPWNEHIVFNPSPKQLWYPNTSHSTDILNYNYSIVLPGRAISKELFIHIALSAGSIYSSTLPVKLDTYFIRIRMRGGIYGQIYPSPPEGAREGEALGNSWRQRDIFDRISRVES